MWSVPLACRKRRLNWGTFPDEPEKKTRPHCTAAISLLDQRLLIRQFLMSEIFLSGTQTTHKQISILVPQDSGNQFAEIHHEGLYLSVK